MEKPKGFTLIELLVVIAVIAVLTGILVPTLHTVRKAAKATICRTNVRQWGLVFKLYGQDNNAKLPQSVAGGSLDAQEAYWIVGTLPYYRDKAIRICPSTKIVREPTAWQQACGGTFACWGPYLKGNRGSWFAEFDTGSYGVNDRCATPPPSRSTYWGFSTDNSWKTQLVRGGDRIPLLGDSVTVDSFVLDGQAEMSPLPEEPPFDDGWSMSTHGSWSPYAMRLFCLPRHEGKVNLVFLDGSVGAVPLRALWKLKWHRNFNVNGHWSNRDADWPQWMRTFGDEY